MNLKALFEQHSHSTYIESEEGFHRVMLAKDFARAAAEIRRQEQQDTVARIVKSLDATANDLLGRQASASLAEQCHGSPSGRRKRTHTGVKSLPNTRTRSLTCRAAHSLPERTRDEPARD